MYVDPTFRQVTPSAKEDIRFFKPLPVPEEGDDAAAAAPYRDFGGPLFEHDYESFEYALGWLRDVTEGCASEEAVAAFLEEHAGLQLDTSPGSAAGSAIPDDVLERLAGIPFMTMTIGEDGAVTQTVQSRG